MMTAGCKGGPDGTDPGRLTCQNVNLTLLITLAYNLKPYQLTALPWMSGGDAGRFDVVATAPPGTTPDQSREMLQDLLAQRFGLVVHHDKKELPTEVLAVGKGGPKLKEAAPVSDAAGSTPAAGGSFANGQAPKMGPDGFPEMPASAPPGAMMMMMSPAGMRIQSAGQTMEGLANQLARLTGEPVTDSTGLTGKYDITLTFSPEGLAMVGGRIGLPPPPPGMVGGDNGASADAPPPAPPLAEALQQQLGLKLEHAKAMVDMIVVDKAEKTPSGN